MQYTKIPLDIPSQVARLKSRGLIIDDDGEATRLLSHLNLYRLRGYTFPFQDEHSPTRHFREGTHLGQIVSLYEFDHALRQLVFGAMACIEIGLRSKIITRFALSHGSHWHEMEVLFFNPAIYQRDFAALKSEIRRSSEPFIAHYQSRYSAPETPPAWMAREVASFGLLSKFYKNLKNSPEKRKIALDFGLRNPDILESWMYAFAQVRNICAHHGRLWNRRLSAMPQIPSNPVFPFLSGCAVYPNKLFAILSCTAYILRMINPGNAFTDETRNLLSSCPQAELQEMGFPQNFEKLPLWYQLISTTSPSKASSIPGGSSCETSA
jgi:abortive infection bacteriophage resistance protein